MERANAHVPQSPVCNVAEYPLPASAGRDAQVEGAAIGIHAGLLGARHPERRQSVERSSHRPLPADAISFAHINKADPDRPERTGQDNDSTEVRIDAGFAQTTKYMGRR